MGVVITKTTAAATANIDVVGSDRGTTFQLYGTATIGAAASEYVEILLRGVDTTDANVTAKEDGDAIRLDVDNTQVTIYGNLKAVLSKTTTANAVGVLKV